MLVTGAVGAVGRFAVHAARARGALVVAAVRASQAEEARRLGGGGRGGARRGGGVARRGVRRWEAAWHGAAFDDVADTVGGAEVAALCRHLAPGGSIVTAATTPVPAEGLGATPVFFAVHQDGARLARLLQAVAAGEIIHPVARCMKLEEAAAAHALVEAGGCGKIALVM
ncbi:MAG: zinc-binding dehydrogenase [Rhodospirillales bacterium]